MSGPEQSILIIDDDKDITRILGAKLAGKGYRVACSNSGSDGLDKARRELPDLILLDIMMPGMNGFEVCRELKGAPGTKNIPILLLTALQDTTDKVKGLDAGADDFISKPFDDSELFARVRAFLRTRQLWNDLEASYRKLKKLEELRDSLNHMIVHDLKNPLSVIYSNVTVVLEELERNDRASGIVKRFLRHARINCTHQMNLIDDILDINLIEEKGLPLKKSRVNFTAVMDHCLAAMETLRKEKNLAFKKDYSEGIPPLLADKTVIQRVILNLMSNSIKFTPNGGRIKFSVQWKPGGHRVECSVEDSGSGISGKDLDKIFDKYFQGDNTARKGHGLGLTFCKMALEAHGGGIRAESVEGKGSRFTFWLPVQPDPGKSKKPRDR